MEPSYLIVPDVLSSGGRGSPDRNAQDEDA
jgi:hypothetical protein